MIDEAAPPIQLNRAISVAHFQVQVFCIVFCGSFLSSVQQLAANSLPTMRPGHEQFVDPSAFAAILQAVIETDNQVSDGLACLFCEISYAVNRILQKFRNVAADHWL